MLGPPALTKTFTPAQILVNGTSVLTFTINNPNTSLALTGIGFSDNMPPNLLVAPPSGLTGSCGGGTITAGAGSGSIALAGAALAGGASCTFSVRVTSSVASIYPNVTTTVTSNEQGPGPPVVATLTVVGPPSITKLFGKTSIPLNQVTTLTLAVINPNPTVALTGVGFTDVLPSGLIAPNASLAMCGGTFTVTTTNNISTVKLTAASLTPPANNVCPLTFAVIGVAPGVFTNTTSAVTSNEAGSGPPASATITVVAPPVISKTFGTAVAIPVGVSATLSFTITNPNVPVSLTGVGFTDILPPGLVVSTPNGVTGSCGGGAITAAAGTNTIALAGATLAPQTSCAFSVNVIATEDGLQNNTTSAVDSVEGGPGNTATASITTGDVFQTRYAANLNAGDSVVNVTNTGTSGGNICVNVYVFSPDEQLVSCCSCLVTTNGLSSLSARNDLISNTFTPAVPSAAVIKLLNTLPVGATCDPTSPTALNLAPGIAAWGTTIHARPGTPASYGVTETPFSQRVLSEGELTRIRTLCSFIQGNGSGFGICKACRTGGLGAAKQ